jgi:hypothetical protein
MGIGKRRIQPQRLALVQLGFVERSRCQADQAEAGPRGREIPTSLQGGAVEGFRGRHLTGTVEIEAALETGPRLVDPHLIDPRFIDHMVRHATLP